MKKTILTFVAFTAITITNAQDKPKLFFGAKVGANISTLVGKDVTNATPRLNYHVGGLLNVPIAEKFSFQPELLFSVQGAKESDSSTSTKYESISNFYYLHVPLLFQYHIIPKLNLEAGLQIGFLLDANMETKRIYFRENKESTSTYNVKESLATTDFSLSIGSSYYITKKLFVGGRYNAGISPISKESSVKVRNSVFQIGLGCKF